LWSEGHGELELVSTCSKRWVPGRFRVRIESYIEPKPYGDGDCAV
jgi:hypothetical protein